jgi:hypothetical protein
VSLALQNISCTPSAFLRKKMSSNSYSIDTIASALGLDKSIVSRVLQNLIFSCKIPCSSHLSKHSDYAQCSVVRQIITRRAANTVQALEHIRIIIPDIVPLHTVRNLLMRHSFKAAINKKDHCTLTFQKEALDLCFGAPGVDCGGLAQVEFYQI